MTDTPEWRALRFEAEAYAGPVAPGRSVFELQTHPCDRWTVTVRAHWDPDCAPTPLSAVPAARTLHTALPDAAPALLTRLSALYPAYLAQSPFPHVRIAYGPDGVVQEVALPSNKPLERLPRTITAIPATTVSKALLRVASPIRQGEITALKAITVLAMYLNQDPIASIPGPHVDLPRLLTEIAAPHAASVLPFRKREDAR